MKYWVVVIFGSTFGTIWCFPIHGAQWMKPADFRGHLIFPLAPPWGWSLWFWVKCLDNYWMDYRDIWCRHWRSPSCKKDLVELIGLLLWWLGFFESVKSGNIGSNQVNSNSIQTAHKSKQIIYCFLYLRGPYQKRLGTTDGAQHNSNISLNTADDTFRTAGVSQTLNHSMRLCQEWET